MLKTLRENLRSLSWVLLLVVVVFIASLFTDYGGKGRWLHGETGDWAAVVDGETIATHDFLAAARNLDGYYRNLLGEAYDRQKGRLSIGQTAINQLVQEELIQANARSLGLTVTPTEIRDEIVHDPNLQMDGAFIGVDRYKTLLRRSGIDVARYEEEVGRRALRRKWVDLVTAGITVSDADVTREIRRRGDNADLDYAVFEPKEFVTQVQLTDSDLRKYYEANPAKYDRGEGRILDLILFDRLREQRNVKLEEKELRAEYDTSVQSRFTTSEQRRASHILIKTAEEASEAEHAKARQRAAEALARVRAGEDFAKVAREASEDSSATNGGDLGFFQKGVMTLPFEQAAWALKTVGDVSGVIQSEFGYHIIKLTGIQEPRAKPFEEVREEIARDLAFKKSGDVVREQAQAFAAVVENNPESFREEAARRTLVRTETPVLRAGDPLPGLGPSPDLERAVMSLQPGQVSPPVPVTRGYVIARCLETRPAGPAPFDEIRERVSTDLSNERSRELALRLARQAVSRPGGRPLKEVGTALGFTVQEARSVAHGIGIGTLGVDPQLEQAVFTAPLGRVSGPLELAAGTVVLEVLSRKEVSEHEITEQLPAVREQLLASQRQQLAAAITRELAKAANVRYNTALIARIDGAESASAAAPQ